MLDADVVVVGSGAGGGVVAAELARAGRSVARRRGGAVRRRTEMPRDELDAYGRLYLNHGLLSTWDGAITMLAGSGVGGGTLVNWMTCLDAPADVRAEWARDHGLDGVDGAEWATDVAVIERELGVGAGDGDPAEGRAHPPRRRGARLGIAAPIRRNASDCGDCGSCPFGCRRGAKQSGHPRPPRRGRARTAPASSIARAFRQLITASHGDGPVTGVLGTLAPAGRHGAGRAGAARSRSSAPARSCSLPARCAARRSCRHRASRTRRSVGTCASIPCP